MREEETNRDGTRIPRGVNKNKHIKGDRFIFKSKWQTFQLQKNNATKDGGNDKTKYPLS